MMRSSLQQGTFESLRMGARCGYSAGTRGLGAFRKEQVERRSGGLPGIIK